MTKMFRLVTNRCAFPPTLGDVLITFARLVRGRVVLSVAVAVALATGSAGCDWSTQPAPAVPTLIIITPSSVALGSFGESVQLFALVHDQDGQVMADAAVTWASSDASVAAVSTAGLVTAVRNGNATVTASAGAATGAAAVIVAQEVEEVVVSPAVDTLVAVGDTARLIAEARDANGHLVEGAAFIWASSDASVARVDGSGLVTAVRNGTVDIRANTGSVTGTAVVRVVQSASSVAVSPAEATIVVGDSLELLAEAFDENGHWVSEPEFTWASSDASVARVDDFGLVWGVAEGSATITAAAGDAHGMSDITVENPDRTALVAFYEATGGPNWRTNRGWLTDAPLGKWFGVSVDAQGRVTRLELYQNDLTGSVPRELGKLANLTELWLSVNDLTGPIPPELGNLTSLEQLDLGGNTFTGPIPPELGNLASLERLNLGGNALTTGPIPQSFLQLGQLTRASFGNGVCVPGTSVFVAWRQERDVSRVDYPRPGVVSQTSLGFCNAADVGVLRLLHETTGGPGWTNRQGWHGREQTHDPSDFALEEWYGVSADSLGRVTGLDLVRNGLDGGLPTVVSELAQMTELKIGGNNLSGRLPLSLARLRLQDFRYSNTGLCTPRGRAFRDWLNAIPIHQGTGAECPVLSDREILEVFYEATNPRNVWTGSDTWIRSNNWLTPAPLEDWYGVSVDDQGRVTRLIINRNNLSGSLPAELGELANLTTLDLNYNRLTGSIPPELGKLANLTVLRIPGDNLARSARRLANNDLSGPIPSELGELSSLRVLDLGGNDLTGTIPAELGNLASLEWLNLGGSDLTGPIPPELGNLTSLKMLDLAYNRHTGSVPDDFGNLARLEWLYLGSNDLMGTIPPELGSLASVRELDFTDNPALEGSLPFGLTALAELDLLGTSGTALCAPSHPTFQAWLKGIARQWIVSCSTPMAYLTQAVQSPDQAVPLVAGEEALLRVFVTANRPTRETLPAVRARFFLNGQLAHTEDIASKSTTIPTLVDESNLWKSANAEIPGHVVQPGLEMVIEVDPAGALDRDLGIPNRIPATGRLAIDVRALPLLDLTLIPFIWNERPEWSIIDLIEAMAGQPDSHEMLWATRTLLPVGDLDVKAHEPVLVSTNKHGDLLSETRAIQALEGGTGHYMGMMAGGSGGIAYLPGRVSFSSPDPESMAHELGHNFNLPHAPCGVDGPWFPHAEGSIGVWGYDFRAGGRLVHPSRPDLMSYCSGAWISDYHFARAARYRLADAGTSATQPTASPRESLLLWGGTGPDGALFLQPAFVTEAPAVLPQAGGGYRLTGWTRSGTELFSLAFDMAEVADGDGRYSFAFVLPVQPGWKGNLTSITLSGSGGSVKLDEGSNLPMVILRNPRTGQIRGILRNLPDTALTQADAAAAVSPALGIEVLFSRGIPSEQAWRR